MIEYIESKEVAYMQLEEIKRKHPHIVLEYLISRIKFKYPKTTNERNYAGK